MARGAIERPPWCGQCSEDGRLVEVPDGTAGRCPRCHPATQPGEKHDPIRARRRSKRTRTYNSSPFCAACGQRVVRNHSCRASALIGVPK